MNEPTCKTCQYYRPHYIKFDETRFSLTPCGHCVYPRLKHRRSNTPACVHYIPVSSESSAE